MPHQLVGVVIPVANVSDWSIGIFLQNLVPAMLLRGGQSLIGIDLKELDVPGLRGSIRGAIAVLNSRVDASGRGSLGRTARPGVRLCRALGRRGEAALPHRPFSILALPVTGDSRSNAVGTRILVPASRRHVKL